MKFLELLGKQLLLFDGAMGTLIQKAGLEEGVQPDIWCATHPDEIENIHRAYLRAGCHIITTNTFGSTVFKLDSNVYTPDEIVRAAVACAKRAIENERPAQPAFVALDIGPSGKLLEPLGDLRFEDAVAGFAQVVRAGASAGADLVLIETMSDTYEIKAAVLAAKEACNLPVCATVALDANERLLTGGDIAAVIALLEGLRVDALGINCGGLPLGEVPALVKKMRALSSLPLIVMPNAGSPHDQAGSAVFEMTPEDYAAVLREAVELGAQVLGGCCGTTPAHMETLSKACAGLKPHRVISANHTVASSYGRAIAFGEQAVLIGERINPTGKPRLKEALRAEEYAYILQEAIEQQTRGAQALDVNAGLPGIDEAALLPALVARLQGVTDLPLQIDTADVTALSAALRVYNGKAIINSVNGKEESMRAVFPLVQKYGGVVVALTLDETGIPETVEGRLTIARRIIARAAEYGIDKKDLLIDTLTMTISAGQENALTTLETLRRVRTELGVNTVLGVSNVSFGLPNRKELNTAFFTLALGAGLSAAIMNPYDEGMMNAYTSAEALLNRDAQCANYIARFGAKEQQKEQAPATKQESALTLETAIRRGLKDQARALAKQALQIKPPLEVIDGSLVPALNTVGAAFEAGTLFLPQLLMSADAAKAAFDELRAGLDASTVQEKGCVVIATVRGDVHDIGKNIVRALLENYQFQVVDLGKNVPPEAVVEAVKKHGAHLAGLSALMTTTVASMKETIALLNKECPGCKVMVGGAVLSKDYAEQIGADRYARDAMGAVHYAQEIYK